MLPVAVVCHWNSGAPMKVLFDVDTLIWPVIEKTAPLPKPFQLTLSEIQ